MKKLLFPILIPLSLILGLTYFVTVSIGNAMFGLGFCWAWLLDKTCQGTPLYGPLLKVANKMADSQ